MDLALTSWSKSRNVVRYDVNPVGALMIYSPKSLSDQHYFISIFPLSFVKGTHQVGSSCDVSTATEAHVIRLKRYDAFD